jgi:ABC-type molybdenum transport system ATPase subunit/photorepair protein PhrA
MIERIYIDNIRTFVNFEWKPEQLALLFGENGSGKSALMEVLQSVQRLTIGDDEIDHCFPVSTRTRWDRRTTQTLEIDVRGDGGLFRYKLVMDDANDLPGLTEIRQETLSLDGAVLMDRARDLPAANVTRSSKPRRARRTALDNVASAQIDEFLSLMQGIWTISPDPRAMSGRVHESGEWLQPNLSNFAGWYRGLLLRKTSVVAKALLEMGEILSGFAELTVDPVSRASLQARFEPDEGASYSVQFDELSDGQRLLIALYVLLRTEVLPGRTFFFDEPDNYLALREIQPWLMELVERAGQPRGVQIWLATHHPEGLNLLAQTHGWRFFREGAGPTRIERFRPVPGLVPAEAVARGWTT